MAEQGAPRSKPRAAGLLDCFARRGLGAELSRRGWADRVGGGAAPAIFPRLTVRRMTANGCQRETMMTPAAPFTRAGGANRANCEKVSASWATAGAPRTSSSDQVAGGPGVADWGDRRRADVLPGSELAGDAGWLSAPISDHLRRITVLAFAPVAGALAAGALWARGAGQAEGVAAACLRGSAPRRFRSPRGRPCAGTRSAAPLPRARCPRPRRRGGCRVRRSA
jgi:hypothetical protein